MIKKFLSHIFFVFLAFIAVWIMANQKVEVYNKKDLSAVSCGRPFKFMVNDLSYRDPPFPWKISCLAGEWGDPTKFFYWPQFIVDVLAFYALIVFLRGIYVLLKKKAKHTLCQY